MAFERDLGYLEAFLAKLGAAAQALPAGAGRDRLAALLREESERWAEIAKLLGPVAQQPPPARSYTAAKEKFAELVQSRPAAVFARPTGLTVGSLRRT